jgi:hypothetical protein
MYVATFPVVSAMDFSYQTAPLMAAPGYQKPSLQ